VRAALVTEHAPLAGVRTAAARTAAARTAAVRALGDLIVNYRSTLLPGAHR
jgi:hypothetical protein